MSATDQQNITIGRQAWASTPVRQMLGAGTSNSPNASEIGLSGNPAAMQHGLVVEPPQRQQKQQEQPASPPQQHIGVQGVMQQQPPILPTKLPVTRTAQLQPCQPTTATSQMERSVSTAIAQHKQRMAPVIKQKEIEEAQQQQQEQQQQQQRSGDTATGSQTAVGQAQVVAPSATQVPLYQMALQHLKALVLGTPPDALSLGPPWTKWPDYARTNNINALLMGLWPSVSEAVTQQLVLQMAPQLMADMAKTYGAGVLTGLELLEFDLGEVPPRLDGIKVYEEVGDEQVLIEMAVGWGSNIKVTVGATVQLLGYTLKLPITVQNLQLHTRLRVAAQPLLDHYPFAGSVSVSLMEPPHVEFELPVQALGGVDVLALPGVRGLFRLGVRLASRQLAVYPKDIAMPLVPGGAAASGPEGMLEVHLMRVSGLRSEDLIGHSDPYVILRLREGRQLRSRTINNNNNPEFDETFKLLVDDSDTQVLQLIVMDEDLIGGGKVMGVATMPLKQSAAVSMPRTKVPLTLTVQKLMAPQRGIGGMLQLPVRVAGLPLNAAAQGGRKVYQNLAGALGVGRGGQGRSTGVNNLSKVLDETGWLGPSEEYLEEKGKTDWKQQGRDQQQQQPQQGMHATSSSSSSKGWNSWGAPAGETITIVAAAPAGPLEDAAGTSVLQPSSPTGSSSSFHTAFSRSSRGSSVSDTSHSSSPSRHQPAMAASSSSSSAAAAPGGAASQAAAAVAAATAAAAAAAAGAVKDGGQGRRLSASDSSSSSSSSSSSFRTGQVAAPAAGTAAGTAAAAGRHPQVAPATGSSGLSRLASQSAPLLHVYDTAAAGSASEAVSSDSESDVTSTTTNSSSSSFTRQHRGPGGPTVAGSPKPVKQRSKVSVATRAFFSRSSTRGSDQGRVSVDDAEAPPAEVLEHKRQAEQQQQDKGGEAVKQLQTEMTPGESSKQLTGDQLKAIYRGTVFLELTYTPFARPTATATGAGASPAGTASTLSAADNRAIMPHDKGILAVALVCARNLGGWQGEADPYVTLSLMDSAGAMRPGASGGAGGRESQSVRSSTIYNEDSPRWNEKFDFIDVRADSVLLVTVWDQVTIIDAATSLKISRDRFKDQVVGRVKVPVMDVATAGRIRRRWPLQGAMMGDLELILQWIHMDQIR